MSLDTEKHIEQTWGSHKPVLQAIMEVLNPQSVVECGCGGYSTPIIERYAKSIISIEHDVAWSKKQKAISKHIDHAWIERKFGGVIHNGTRRPDLPEPGLGQR